MSKKEKTIKEKIKKLNKNIQFLIEWLTNEGIDTSSFYNVKKNN